MVKISRRRIDDDDFVRLPQALKRALGQLIGVGNQYIILGNSASYGLHILRNGLRWKPGDEVLSVANEFPASIYPWLGLEREGVHVRRIETNGSSLAPGELESEIGLSTRLLCVSW